MLNALALADHPSQMDAMPHDLTAVRKVAFVIPPSSHPICRDYLDTSSSKGSYYWHPTDFWVQGSYLQDTHELRLFEGVYRNPDDMLSDIQGFAPDLVVILAGGFSLAQDLDFLRALHHRVPVPIVVGGEGIFQGAEFWHQQPGVIALMTAFVGDGLKSALAGKGWGHGFVDLQNPARELSSVLNPRLPGELRWGKPVDWNLKPYRYALLGTPFAPVLTSYGCPFRCSYCSNNRDVLGLSLRDLDDLFLELDTWAERGIKWLHFRDVNFGGPAGRAKRILREMIARNYPFRWNTFLRPELIDDEMADLLKRAGCVQIQMGVESANPAILRQVGRNGSLNAVADAFDRLDRAGIRRGAHFVLCLPGETEQDVLDSIAFAVRLNPDYVSFNVAITRGGTVFDQGKGAGDCSAPTQENLIGDIPIDRALALRNQAIRRYYLRPRYLWRTAKTMLKSPALIPGILADGRHLLTR